MDSRALAAAVLTRAQTSPHFLAYEQGKVDTRPAKGYVVLLFNSGFGGTDGRLSATANRLNWAFRARCVGYTNEQCLFVAEKVRTMFLHWAPDTDPGSGWLVEDGDLQDVLPDEREGEIRFSVAPRYLLTTPRSTA